jgi:hypothetical protein
VVRARRHVAHRHDATAQVRGAGHWATGDRAGHRSPGAGTVYVVSVIDDHSRLTYSEWHSAEDRWSTNATLRRAAAWMTEQGCGPIQAVMSDNHKAYTSHHCQAS